MPCPRPYPATRDVLPTFTLDEFIYWKSLHNDACLNHEHYLYILIVSWWQFLLSRFLAIVQNCLWIQPFNLDET